MLKSFVPTIRFLIYPNLINFFMFLLINLFLLLSFYFLLYILEFPTTIIKFKYYMNLIISNQIYFPKVKFIVNNAHLLLITIIFLIVLF